MVQKIFGILFIAMAGVFAWKYVTTPELQESVQKNPLTAKRPPHLHPPSRPVISNDESPFVSHMQKLLAQQTDPVDLIDSIQKISFKSHLTNKKLNTSISNSIGKIADQSSDSPYILEVEIFDTNDPNSKKAPKKFGANGKPIAADKIVFQFSVFDSQNMNKVGEFGATYDAADIAPDLFADASDATAEKDTSEKGKKKPDEAKTSSGQN